MAEWWRIGNVDSTQSADSVLLGTDAQPATVDKVTNERFLPKPKHASNKPGYTRSQLRRLVFVSEPAALHSHAGFHRNDRIHHNNMIK